MTRLLTTALLTVFAAAPLAAQRAEPVSPESIRPQDTEPSIPVTSPTIDPRAASGAAAPSGSGAAAGSRTDGVQPDPDTAVSSTSEPIRGTEPGGAAGAAGGARIVDGAGDGGGAAGSYAGALPERASSPRTLRAHAHVYIAFAVVWALLFGYAISLGRRFSRLEEEVRRLRG
jgi:CcmD family protein